MSAKPEPTPELPPSATDVLFKRCTIVFTTLSLAVMYGWLACFVRLPSGDFHFQWRWEGLLWVIVALLSSVYFWRKIWPPSGETTRNDKIKGSLALFVPCIWWLLLPLRFMSGQHFWDVMSGLIAAALVLTFGAWMVIHLFKAFEGSEGEDFNPDAVRNPETPPVETEGKK